MSDKPKPRYRSVSAAEKRAEYEESGKEWPIGSDGFPKRWVAGAGRPAGGSWRLRSIRRASELRYENSDKGRARCSIYRKSDKGREAIRKKNARMVRVGRVYLGMEHHFPVPRSDVEQTVRKMLDELKGNQATQRKEFYDYLTSKSR